MTDEWDVVIIGAGIVGTACAAACATQGMRTAIVEASVIDGGATAALAASMHEARQISIENRKDAI